MRKGSLVILKVPHVRPWESPPPSEDAQLPPRGSGDNGSLLPRPREAPPHLLPRFRPSGLCLCSFLRLGRPSSPLYWVRSSSSPKCELLHQTVCLIRRREPTLPERAATWQSAHFCTMNVIQNQCLAQRIPEGALELGHSCPRGRGRQSDPPAPQGTTWPRCFYNCPTGGPPPKRTAS